MKRSGNNGSIIHPISSQEGKEEPLCELVVSLTTTDRVEWRWRQQPSLLSMLTKHAIHITSTVATIVCWLCHYGVYVGWKTSRSYNIRKKLGGGARGEKEESRGRGCGEVGRGQSQRGGV